jgi:hypothetical protein
MHDCGLESRGDGMTRSIFGFAFAVALLASGAIASETQEPQAAPTPVPQAEDGPVLEAITQRQVVLRYPVVYPEFHFHDINGNVRLIHRQLISTNAPHLNLNADGVITISADQQRKGAVFVGEWNCGPESYYATIEAYLMDLDGKRSNALQYTIRCNGG